MRKTITWTIHTRLHGEFHGGHIHGNIPKSGHPHRIKKQKANNNTTTKILAHNPRGNHFSALGSYVFQNVIFNWGLSDTQQIKPESTIANNRSLQIETGTQSQKIWDSHTNQWDY